MESAFTTETPTPCKPPETLYESTDQFSPACNSVITISADQLPSSSVCISTGIPLPLSKMRTELSDFKCTVISVQNPAKDSSIELSKTENHMVVKIHPVSPIYIPGPSFS